MTFEDELSILINRCSQESESNTPDFILAGFLHSCLIAYSAAVCRRDAHAKGGMWPVGEVLPVYKNPPPTGGRLRHSKFGGAEHLGPVTGAPMVWHDDKPPRPEYRPISVPPRLDWRAPLMHPCLVEGHKPGCDIDLDTYWTACTCGAG